MALPISQRRVAGQTMPKLQMPSVSFIVARSRESHVIGCENQLPWKLRSDLRRFRQITTGHPVIMGRKTFESIGHKLPNRLNIILSRNTSPESDLSASSIDREGISFVSKPEDALLLADRYSLFHGSSDIFIIGGETIYYLFLRLVNTIYLTEVDADIRGDAHFSELFPSVEWKKVHAEKVKKDENDEYDTEFIQLEKIRKIFRYREIKKFSLTRIDLGRNYEASISRRLVQAELLKAWKSKQGQIEFN
ncbi:dihydrofolate reductase [Lichenihabitans sp. PAMC28606]|uniref:dihydrofolate reductase n=1 Tax=Lichenihabitans sp. PAMC28606 TaxID=2880932 RepID=UPI001D0A6C8F|nr:dihydrofolate reductase [Lichenihabitans sp. PAMC28606]UDL93623.1 dihydrofolate reductase [Lichenihabitans sp. PAMC28606]